MTLVLPERLLGEWPVRLKNSSMQVVRGRVFTVLVVLVVCFLFVMLYCAQSDVLGCCQRHSQTRIQISSLEVPYSMRGELEEYTDEFGVSKLHYKHTKRQLPHCIIIGVRKGGTRALLEFLNLHPAIQAEKSEMHFFDVDENYANGLEWYRKHMPFSFMDQLTIEKTPAYFTEEEVPQRVHAMNSSIKLLLIMRDPIERAISDYTQIHTNKKEKGRPHQRFEEIVWDAQAGEVNRSYKAIRRSLYHRHMARWLRYFPLEQFHFVSGENLVRHPADELRRVEDFLGIEHHLTQDKFLYNNTRGFYCMKLDSKEKCLARSKGRKHPDIDPVILHRLRVFFRPHNHEFYDQVGINFGWQEA